MNGRAKTALWLCLLVGVIGWFFHECLFRGFSLVPTDVGNQLVLPYSTSFKHIQVQNHYAVDTVTIGFPWAVFWQKSVKSGQLPIWNPYILGGQPILAESMPAVLSPFNLLLLILSPERALSLGTVLAFCLAGLFMFALLRDLGRSHPASFIGACAWALNSSFLMWHWRTPAVFCWAPLVLLLLERSAKRDSWSEAMAAGLVLGAAFLCSSVQAGVHIGFLCACYGFSMVLWRDPSRRVRMLERVGLMLVLGALASAVQWLPTLELMTREAYGSMNARGPQVGLRQTLLGIPLLITFVFPALTGSTETYDLLKVAGTTRGYFTGYIGIVPFALFVIGACVSTDRRVRGALLMLAVVLVLLFFTPLVKYLYHRFFVVMVFAMAFIAAYGADVLMAPSVGTEPKIQRVWLWLLLLGAVVAAGVLVAQGFIGVFHEKLLTMAQRYVAREAVGRAFSFRSDWFQERVPMFFAHYRITNIAFWLPLSALLGAAAAWRVYRRRWVSQAALCAILVILTILDLTVSGRQLVPRCDLKRYPLWPKTAVLNCFKEERDLYRVYQWNLNGPPNTSPIFLANWLMAYGVQNLGGTFSLAPETIQQMLCHSDDKNNELLNLANVKYIFSQTNSVPPPGRLDLIQEAEGVRLYRNPQCLPRLQFYGQWEVVPDRQQILARMTADAFDPREMVFLEEQPRIALASSNAVATITVERYANCRVVVRINASHDGVLLLADTWYPGWKARVDGHATPLYRADYVLRATEVTAGEHLVEFYFQPLTFLLGLAISVVATVGVILFALLKRRQRINRDLPTNKL